MSEKARDGQGRWRSKTIAFRISPEENDLLEEFVRLSGLTKQEYVINRVLERQITVIPNPRVHKALRDKMEQLCIQLASRKRTPDQDCREVVREPRRGNQIRRKAIA